MLRKKKVNKEGKVEDSGKNQSNLKERGSRGDGLKARSGSTDYPWTRKEMDTFFPVIEGKGESKVRGVNKYR